MAGRTAIENLYMYICILINHNRFHRKMFPALVAYND